ncbi:MAG TPA: hypothetical protein VLJ42_06515 [Solirubrobacteraceae bacterium]|nr:hypothetical protein [Solirubrobacteraceae bacterium]
MIEIRSYRTVFDLERRVYRIDSLRLNPGGVPVRGIVYFLATVVGALILSALPLIGAVPRMLPWYMRDLALPAVSAAVLTLIRVEGRPFHVAALALLRYATKPHRLAALRPCPSMGERWHPPELLVLPDGSDARLRALSYTGPGAVLVNVAHECAEWRVGVLGALARRPRLTLRQLPGELSPDQGQVIALAAGTRLRVRSAPTAASLTTLAHTTASSAAASSAAASIAPAGVS